MHWNECYKAYFQLRLHNYLPRDFGIDNHYNQHFALFLYNLHFETT